MYEIKIPCPDNPKHQATLYTHGHQYAGIWECETCEVSDVCDHTHYHSEDVENTPTTAYDWIFTSKVAVCDLCDCTVDDVEVGLVEQDCSI